MVNLEILRDLSAHMRWADAEVWKAVLAHPPAAGDDRMREILYHIHLVQRAFLMLWRGEEIGDNMPKFDDAVALLGWAKTCYPEAAAYLESAGEARLSEPVTMPWAGIVEAQLGGKPENATFGETALQVAMHSTYHRGQANARLRELGGEPPLVDYIAWLWRGRPEAEWP